MKYDEQLATTLILQGRTINYYFPTFNIIHTRTSQIRVRMIFFCMAQWLYCDETFLTTLVFTGFSKKKAAVCPLRHTKENRSHSYLTCPRNSVKKYTFIPRISLIKSNTIVILLPDITRNIQRKKREPITKERDVGLGICLPKNCFFVFIEFPRTNRNKRR